MANAAQLLTSTPGRILLEGYPGAGKTGALCCLVNAGLKLRVLAYDMAANFQPLLQYCDRDKLANVDIVFFEDKLRNGAKFIETVGIPTAFADGLKMMDRWKYKDEKDNEVDLGQSKDWGPDTVVMLDSLTAMGEAAKRRAMAMLNKTPLNSTQQMWGLAMQDQFNFLMKLLSSSNRFHVIVTAHLKTVGPKDILPTDESTTKDIKERLVELVPTRLYPSALGQQLPPQIGALFSTVLLVETKYGPGSKVSRVMRSCLDSSIDLKMPAVGLPDTLPQESGLLQVLEAQTGGPSVWFANQGKESA